MKKYRVSWAGVITRDVGWDEISAETPAAAWSAYEKKHPMRRVRGVCEVE